MTADELRAKYPALFAMENRERGGSPFERFGFEIGDGWLPLLEELAAKIQDQPVRFSQVKEKFGLLRVYVDAIDDSADMARVFAAVDEAEEKSATVCEQCGKPGRRTGAGWLKTACDEHGNGAGGK